MQAQYSPESRGYIRHFDAEGLNDRRVTIIVYINDPDWTATDGGQLRLWQPSDASASSIVDLNPSGDGSCNDSCIRAQRCVGVSWTSLLTTNAFLCDVRRDSRGVS